MKTKILGLLVLLLIIGGVAYMLNNKSADKVVDKGLESSTQLAPGENTEQVVDTRTPEEINAEEDLQVATTNETQEAPVANTEADAINAAEDAASDSSPELPATVSEGELVGGDAVAPTETPGEVSFTVLGGKFYYDIKEMRVKEGDTVTVTFRSVDGFHDWTLDEFNAQTESVSTGNESTVTFVADKKGTFEYYCSVGSHRDQGQVGTLIVE